MIELIRDRETLANISNEWSELADSFGTPLLSHEWFISCAESFYNENALCIVVARSNSKMVAIAPLVIIRSRGFEHLELLGSSFLGEPSGLLYYDDNSLKELIKSVLKLRRPLFLHRIPNDATLFQLINTRLSKNGVFIKRNTSGSAYVPIDTSWDEFFRSLSSKRRYDLRRASRRADEFRKVAYKIICPTPAELDANLSIAFKIEAAGWKGRKGSALLNNDKLNTFFKKYSLFAAKKKILRLCFLFIDETPVAMLIGLEYQNRFWVLKIGYDEKYSNCSPGILLIHETIRYAFDKEMKSYEFLGSDEPWLRMWAKHNLRNYVSLGLYSPNIHGLAALTYDFKRFGVRKLSGFYKRQNNS